VPRLAECAYSTPPAPLAGFSGERREERGKEGDKKGRGGKGKGWKGPQYFGQVYASENAVTSHNIRAYLSHFNVT